MATQELPEWTKEYNDGWDELVDTLVKKLYAIDPNLNIQQIKEKFGGLRAYIDPSWDADEAVQEQFEQLIGEAEKRSFTICEQCGQTGKTISINGWYRTLCPQDEQATITAAAERNAKAKADREEQEQRKAKEITQAKASTICRECGETGKYRKQIRNEIAVLCDNHFNAWLEAYEERKAHYIKKREEILAKKEN